MLNVGILSNVISNNSHSERDSGWQSSAKLRLKKVKVCYAKRDRPAHIKLSTICHLSVHKSFQSRTFPTVWLWMNDVCSSLASTFRRSATWRRSELSGELEANPKSFFGSPLQTRPSNTRKNWARFQASELRWLLDHLHENFASFKDGLEECVALLLPQEPGSTLALSTVRSESIKGYVTRVGAWIVKGVSEIQDHPQFWYFCVYGLH